MLSVPAPLSEDPALKLKVPFEKFSVAPAAALKPDASVPPPEKSRVPAFAFTAPVLLNTTLTVLETPPVIWKVPALLNVLAVPPLKMMPFALPFTMVQVAPERLLITAPFCSNRLLLVVVVPAVVVPETVSVRALRTPWPEGRLIPPLALVTPVPLMVPPVQVNSPVIAK